MNVSIICPLYKAQNYIDSLHKSILKQKKIEICEIKYILTDTGDKIEEKLRCLEKVKYEVIQPKDFSHSLSREKAGLSADGDIIVFISQDIIIEDDEWLYKFIRPIIENKCEAAYSKQICTNNSIERYTRSKNYGDKSIIISKKDINDLGIMAFFFSDAASAIKSSVYKELKAYDGKDLLTNEDMYFAYKLINSGYRKMYNAEAVVVHSHDYKLKEVFKRYFDQGVFLADNNYLLGYKANDSAVKLVKFIVIEAMREKNLEVLIKIAPNFASRFIGNKLGQNYRKLSEKKINKYSSNSNYWERKRSR